MVSEEEKPPKKQQQRPEEECVTLSAHSGHNHLAGMFETFMGGDCVAAAEPLLRIWRAGQSQTFSCAMCCLMTRSHVMRLLWRDVGEEAATWRS